jgi:hypothetical protein
VTTTQNLAQAAMLYPQPVLPMFVGGPNWLQVDVSMPLRGDQLAMGQMPQAMPSGGSVLSDTKTITYFMAAADGLPAAVATRMADGSRGKGLLRREVPRAMNGSAATTTMTTSTSLTSASPEPLAPEVVSIEFLYFDGVNRYPTWDSRQHNSLPKAVIIKASFLAGKLDASPDDMPSSLNPKETVTYQLIVSPAAWRPVPAWLTAMMNSNSGGMPGMGTGMQGTGTGMQGAGAY